MANKDSGKSKASFFSNKWNLVLTIITVVLAFIVIKMWFIGDEEGRRMFDEVTRPGGILGRKKPPAAELEGHYKDNAGSLPVKPDFDADPGEICGNGKSYYWTSKPPKKPIPPSWEPPPLPGTDPNYEGPDPTAPFKESPYAMPSSTDILARIPIHDRNDPKLMVEIKKALARAPGKVGYLGIRDPKVRFGELGPHLVKLDPAKFTGDDDEPVAKQLLENKIDFVLMDRVAPGVKPWIEEKMSTVLIRLRDAVSLAWFHPVVLGSGYALFRVAPPFEIPKHLKRRITARIRSQLLGEKPEEFDMRLSSDAVGANEFRVIVSLRWRNEPKLKGRKVTKKMAHGATFIDAIDKATKKIRDSWGDIRKKAASTYGVDIAADLPRMVANMEIEVDVLYDMCALTDRTPALLVWYLEMGLEGLTLRGNKTMYYLEPSYAVHMETKSEITFLERMLLKSGLNQFLRDPKKKKIKKIKKKVLYETPWKRDKEFRFGRFRTLHWIETPGGGDIVELYRGIPLKTIWDVSRASLIRSLELGAQWLMVNQADDGSYAYKYTPTNKPGRRWTPGSNIVRHALNPYTLLMVNKLKANPKLVESAKKGIAFTLSFLRHQGDRCVICHRDMPARYYNAKLGTVAVTILSILKLGDVADISEYDKVLRCLGEALIYNQDKNGHFRQYDVPEDHPYYGAESTIAPGEFIFALARMYSHYKDEKYKESIDRALPFYMTAWRKLLSERTKEGIYDEKHRVDLIGIVPWLVTALNDLHKMTGEQRYADLAFEQQDWIDDEFFWFLNRSQYPDYVGASFKVHRELPAINSCQYTEGAAAAYDLIKRVGEGLEHRDASFERRLEKRRQVVVHGMRFCLQLQFDSYGSTFFLPLADEAMGGYRYTLGHLRLRNDYSYHAMAAIAQAAEYLEADDYPAERPLRIPPVLRELLGGMENPVRDVLRGEKRETPAQPEGATATEPAAAPQ